MPAGRGNAFTGDPAGRNVWQNMNCHKSLSRKKGKKNSPLLSKPHILLSQMVLLSEHLTLNVDWMKFPENHALKKAVAHSGETNVSCFFSGIMICGFCGLLHMEHFFSFRLACLLPVDVVSTAYDWPRLGRAQGGSFTQCSLGYETISNPRPSSELLCDFMF